MGVFVDRSKSCKSKDAKTRKKIKKVKSSEQSKTSRHGYSHTNWWPKILLVFNMTSPWAQSYKFVTENAGRFANDIAMGTVIHICDEKC